VCVCLNFLWTHSGENEDDDDDDEEAEAEEGYKVSGAAESYCIGNLFMTYFNNYAI
jgi:hypothetical protein